MKTKEACEAGGGEKNPAERSNKRISDSEREQRVRTCAEMVRWKVLLVEVSFDTLLCGVQ